jgi:hypothetical protein
MRVLLNLFLALVFMGGTAQLCFAQTDSFNVRFSYGSDSEAPTTPAPFSVTPMAATQIDIAWGTSTDNTVVVGYQLFRDALQIATTTLTSFSDTSLTASTTYAYNVIAFDGFGNFSTSSVMLATTTFALPPPLAVATSTARVGESATIARLLVTSFEITPSTNGAKLSFSTNMPTRFVLRYGISSVYDAGTIESPIYKSTHTTSLFPLEAGTAYVYELYGFDRFGNQMLLAAGDFSTIALPDTTAPANVANFSATPIGTDVFLRWDNPTDDDFVYVRIVRNHLFYPLNESDGFLVYEGSANSVTDQGGLSSYDEQYYTIFTYDSSGNVSSGAIAYAAPQPMTESGSPDGGVTTGTTPDQVIEDGIDGQSTIDMTVLYASSVQLLQGGIRQSLSDQSVTLDSRLSYELFIPIEAVPENLKTIIATVVNPSNQRSATTYLLKINSKQTGYSALISAPMVVGSSRVTIQMIDYSQGTVRRIEQSITFVASREAAPPLLSTLSKQDIFPWIIQGSVMLFLLFLLYVIYSIHHQSKIYSRGLYKEV